jgi:hypothetical protein
MKILEMHFKVKYCEMNKLNNLHIVISTYNPRKLPKSGQHMQKTEDGQNPTS